MKTNTVTFFLCLLLLNAVVCSAEISIKCPKGHCGEDDERIFRLFIQNTGSGNDAVLYDSRKSGALSGYRHFRYLDSVSGIPFLITTDGKYMGVNVLRIFPGRDFSGIPEDKKTEKIKEAERAQVSVKNRPPAVSGGQMGFNALVTEQDGMFLGPIDIKGLLADGKIYRLIEGKGKGTVILVDWMKNGRLADFMDRIRNGNSEWEPYKDYDIYFAPFFGFMGDQVTAVMGKHFFALLKAGIKPEQAAYVLSKMSALDKTMPNQILTKCMYILPNDKMRKKFQAALTEFPTPGIFLKSEAAFRIGIWQPDYYIANGQFHIWKETWSWKAEPLEKLR